MCAGRQADFWEAALRYEDRHRRAVADRLMARWRKAAASTSCRGRKAPAISAFGLRGDYPLTDEIKASLGGSWRQSNAYMASISSRAGRPSTTRGQPCFRHASPKAIGPPVWSMATASPRKWRLPGLPRLGLTGWEVAGPTLGYRVSASIACQRRLPAFDLQPQQRRRFSTARRQLKMDAVLPASEFAHVFRMTPPAFAAQALLRPPPLPARSRARRGGSDE